jgi:hypothetical protein
LINIADPKVKEREGENLIMVPETIQRKNNGIKGHFQDL